MALSQHLQLWIGVLIAVYDIIGDIGLPFSITEDWSDQHCCGGSKGIYQCGCEYVPFELNDVPLNMSNKEFCKDIICPDCKSIRVHHSTLCASSTKQAIIALAWIGFAITMMKEIVKGYFALSLMLRDSAYRDTYNAALGKRSPLFIFVLLMKPNVVDDYLRNIDKINKEYTVLFIDFFGEDFWSFIASILMVTHVDASAWAIVDLTGSIFMVLWTIFKVRQANVSSYY